jgi:hypothetical protein
VDGQKPLHPPQWVVLISGFMMLSEPMSMRPNDDTLTHAIDAVVRHSRVRPSMSQLGQSRLFSPVLPSDCPLRPESDRDCASLRYVPKDHKATSQPIR